MTLKLHLVTIIRLPKLAKCYIIIVRIEKRFQQNISNILDG